MKVWKDKSGNWITPKEFGQRWMKGIQAVTPLQQTQSQLFFTWMTIVGILCGIIASLFLLKSLWWLEIILVAALGNTTVGLINTYQKYKQLQRIKEAIESQHGKMEVDDGLKN